MEREITDNQQLTTNNEKGQGEIASPLIESSGARNDTGERDYTRRPYQNFIAVHRVLEKNAPLPMTQKQIQEATGISKNMVFDVCWNMVAGGWAEDTGNGGIRLKGSVNDKEAYIGRMVLRLVRDTRVNFEENKI